MNFVRFAPVTAIALVSMLAACGGQEDAEQGGLGKSSLEHKSQKSGYGFEFMKDSVDQSGAAAPSGNQALGANGKLAPETIRDVVRAHFGAIKGCYETALQADPTLAGQIAVKFVIHEDGTVSGAGRESATISDATMVGCVVDGFKTIQFPVSSGGDAKVIYPIAFSPGDDN